MFLWDASVVSINYQFIGTCLMIFVFYILNIQVCTALRGAGEVGAPVLKCPFIKREIWVYILNDVFWYQNIFFFFKSVFLWYNQWACFEATLSVLLFRQIQRWLIIWSVQTGFVDLVWSEALVGVNVPIFYAE